MRILATIAAAFAAGCFGASMLPGGDWPLWAGCAFLVCALPVLLCRKRPAYRLRLLLILFSLAASLFYFTVYRAVFTGGLQDQLGREGEFSGVVTDYPQQTDSGAKVTISLGIGKKAVYYGDESVRALEPGQVLSGSAYWQDAGRIRDDAITTFTSRGVYVLLYGRGEITVESGSVGSIRWLPQRAARAVLEKTKEIWPDETTAAFTAAMLIGERGGLTVEAESAMSEAGLSHLFAVSGLHCTFLVTLLGLLIPAGRRRLFAVTAMAALLFYALMAGLSPSIVRSCIMLMFVLAAPLFRRDSDGLTSLGAAVLVILLANPHAAASISLQLSFAATAGILLFGGKIYGVWEKVRIQNTLLLRLWNFLGASVSTSLGTLVFTVPLTACYFNIFTLLSPLSNLLVVPVAGWAFMLAFVTVVVSFVWMSAAQLLGWPVWALVHYALWVARAVMTLPGHALYFSNRYLVYWLGYVYTMFGVCLLHRGRRKYVLAGVLAALTLLLTVRLGTADYRCDGLGVLALDVGQGESVVLYSGDAAVMVDCGSSNSYIDAGGVAADQLGTMGIRHLTAIVVTHYHADHTNGLEELIARVAVDKLYLPQIDDEFGVKERLLELAQTYAIETVYVEDVTDCPLGQARVRLYPPVGAGDLNEQGLSVLCTAGEEDVLITGDMAGSTEKQLVGRYDLPDIEVLLVSHHGSKYSSAMEFLRALKPEIAVISVGDNSYGHPADEALLRLAAAGCTIYRTDQCGNILLMVQEGEVSYGG